MRMLHALKRALIATEGRHPLLIAIVAFAVFIPALFAGFVIDDHVFRALFKDLPGIDGVSFNPRDTFLFGDGVPEHTQERIEKGLAPWWSPPDWKVGFWRPLSSWSHWFDFQIWGDRPFMMHLESVLLYVLVCLCLYRLYRRTLTPAWMAALAAVLYAVDDGHGIPVAWISNRNTVLSTLFVALTLLFHDRWRRPAREDARPTGARPAVWAWPAALLCLTLGLLSGEAALAVGGYLFAHALFLDTGSYPRRIARLLPYLVIVAVWRLVYSSLGYGIAKAGIYTDPGKQPLQFAIDTVLFTPLLLLNQFAQPDPGLVWMFAPTTGQALFWAAAVAFVVVVARVLWPTLREHPEARFWALGMILSLIPACATMPQARLLMVPGMGAMALIAIFLHRWLEGRERGRIAQGLAYVFVVLHLVLAPLLILATPSGMQTMERVFRESSASLDAIPDLSSKHLIAINTVSDLNAVAIPLLRSAFEEPVPRRTTVLYTGIGDVHLERPGAQSLLVRPDGGFLPRPWGQIFVDPREVRYAPGERVRIDGLEAEIVEVMPDGRPAAVLFTAAHPLDDPNFAFVHFERGRYVPLELPPLHSETRVPGIAMDQLLRRLRAR